MNRRPLRLVNEAGFNGLRACGILVEGRLQGKSKSLGFLVSQRLEEAADVLVRENRERHGDSTRCEVLY